MKYTTSLNLIPENEPERVAALHCYQILNTPAEPEFDNLVKLAKTIFKVPVAHISFLDTDFEFVKAITGLEGVKQVPREDSLCNLAIQQNEVTIIEDALLEPALVGNSAVVGPLGLRFYAGAPIINTNGYIIGTICLIDFSPRTLSDHELEILQHMANVTMDQVELRLSNIEKTKKQQSINEELNTSQEHLQRILDTMAEGVTVVDAKGKLVYANIMAQRIFGIDDDGMKNRVYNDTKWTNLRIDGSVLPEEEHPMYIIRETGMPVYDKEIGVQPINGERFYISINAAPIFDKDGRLSGGIGTFMNVTNRRKLMKQKEEFISIASHELKTPITSLKASVQLLDKLKETVKLPTIFLTLIAQSNKSLDKLTKLVNDLLNTNRIAEGQLMLNKTKFTVADVVKQSSHHINSAGEHHVSIKGDLWLEAFADEQQIEQVVVNLLNNAVKYAPDSKEIIVEIKAQGDKFRVSVSDHGPGVPPDKIAQLFDRYFRADYSGVQFSGLGLGLYISAEIIKKHNGEIGLDNYPGKGSTFWFTLPIA
ncbi:ATP-binding protein [Mucilaginibacter sp.]